MKKGHSNNTSSSRAEDMAAVDSDESDFGDDMALVPSMKAHTGGQGLGAASAPAGAVPLKKVAVHRQPAADVLLAERMRIVQQYDLTTAVGMDARGACTCCGQRHVQDEVAW